jgi:sn-glycerol 3-phosphate transport system substrate-binding protein
MMLSGAIYPVYKLMADTGYDINWNDYLQAVLSYYMNKDGKLMSMPFNSSTPVMYYNADMFKKAGIPLPSKSDPMTWDELGKILKVMIDKKVAPAGLVTAWQSWTQIENYCAIHNLPFATRANGYEGLDCELAFNAPQVVAHIAQLKDWMKDKRFLYGGQKYQGPKAEFIAQNAAVYIDSISGIASGTWRPCQWKPGCPSPRIPSSVVPPTGSWPGIPRKNMRAWPPFWPFWPSRNSRFFGTSRPVISPSP